MNKAIFMGRLAADPELRYTPNGVAVCSFVLAVDRPKQKDRDQETDWPSIVAWRQKAEFASKYLTKGRKVLVTATVRTRTYDDDNGKKHKITEFHAEEIEFCDSKPQGTYGGNQSSSNTDYDPGDGFTPVEDDEELPF